MSPPSVDLEDCHVGDGARDEEDQEDCSNWNIDANRRNAAKTGCCWGIRSWPGL